MKANAELGAKFKGLKSIDEVAAMAKREGYTLSIDEIEELSDVSIEDLGKVAGGRSTGDNMNQIGFFVTM